MTVTITRTQRRFVLPEADLPTHYVNIAADLPEPLPPPLHPGTREPIGPEMLAPLFPMELIRQEVSADPLIEIPEEVREAYRIYRPTPLHRARALEKALDTPARIYFKNEGVSPAGSHKPNTAIAQAFYNRAEGITRLVTRRARGSGAAPSRSPAHCSASRPRCSWCASATSRSRIDAASSRASARRSCRRRRPRRTRVERSSPRIRTRPAALGSRSARRSRWQPRGRTRSTRW